ncbi:MAG: hypothetical protein GYA42_05470 [Syntrophomonadaceae bacterium]|nr:hypothetical protein [Syntrophomonadaceae bacterium]
MKKAASTEINLLPDPGLHFKRLTAIISLAFIVAALAGASHYCYRKEQQTLAEMARLNSDLAAQIETRRAGREDMQPLIKMELAVDELSPLLVELEAKRVPFTTILEEIYNLVPPDTRLSQITMGDSHAIIYGQCANNGLVAQLLDGLKSLSRYGGLVSMQSKLDQSGQGTEFVVEIALQE